MAKLLNKLQTDGVTVTAPGSASANERGGAFSRWWKLLTGGGWSVVKINLLTLLFFLPMVVWNVVISYMSSADGAMLPYSANIGIGLPVVANAVEFGLNRAFASAVRRWMFMIPMIMLGFIGLGGAFTSLSLLVKGEKATVKSFFKGIAHCWLPFLLVSVPVALTMFSLVYNASSLKVGIGFARPLKITFTVLSALLLFVSLVIALFVMTQYGAYEKIKAKAVLKNTALLGTALIHRSTLVLALCCIPFLLIAFTSGFILSFVLVFFILVGISSVVLALSVYGRWAFVRYLEPLAEAEAKPKGDGLSRKQRKRMQASLKRNEENARQTEQGEDGGV
ncbi:MAG: hypothetical protein HFE48_00280 [Clostridia bacterium]|nr:hypothetical protein [Clostridia bacterium]